MLCEYGGLFCWFFIEVCDLHCHFLKRKFREIGTAAMQVSIPSSVCYHPN